MSKIKNYMMDIQEDVWDIDGLETKIGDFVEHKYGSLGLGVATY